MLGTDFTVIKKIAIVCLLALSVSRASETNNKQGNKQKNI